MRKEIVDYNRYLQAKEEVRFVCDRWGAPKGFYDAFKKSGSIYSLTGEHEAFVDDLNRTSIFMRDAIKDYLDELQTFIRSYKNETRAVGDYSPVKDASDMSQRDAHSLFHEVYPRTSVSVYDRKLDGTLSSHFDVSDCGYIATETHDNYYRKNKVYIKPSWGKGIYQKGIAVANSTKGARVVVSALPVKRSYLDEKNITAWKVVHVGSLKKVLNVATGYLAVYDYTGHGNICYRNDGKFVSEKPHVIHSTLADCVSVLDRRIEKAVFDIMGE